MSRDRIGMRTLLLVQDIVRRPHKVRLEVRINKDGTYTVSIIGRSEQKIGRLYAILKEMGYSCSLRIDRYGYSRINVYGADHRDVMLIRRAVENLLSKRVEEVELELNA